MADLSNIINPSSPHAQNIQRILRPASKKVDQSQTKPVTTKMAVAEPKIVRKLLPIAAFLVTFVTVMTMLLLYMDTTAIRHHQFQINMTQDNLMGVVQDNDQLITYIREVHIRSAIEPRLMTNSMVDYEQIESEPTEKERKVAELLNFKKHGTFLETGAYKHGRISDTEWLERNLSWTGLLQQTFPRDFFDLLKKGRTNSKAIHACLSTQPHPKEITIPQEGRDGVKINSIHANSVTSDENDWLINTRIKCFPLYSLILAMNLTNLDFLNIDADCTEYEVLKTLPLERIKVEVISVRLQECQAIEAQPTDKVLKRYLASYNYKFVQKIKDDYIFILNHLKI